MNKEQQRIELLKKVTSDKNKIEVKLVTEIFIETLKIYFDQTQTGKAVKDNLTEAQYNRFLHGFTNSFLSTLYVNASKKQEEFDERLKYVTAVNNDLLVHCEERDK